MTGAMGNVAHAESAENAELAREVQKSAVPRLRFKGCEGAWEEKSLCGFALINPRANIPEQFEYVDLESVVGTKMISHRTVSRTTAPSRAQRLAFAGDIFFQTVRPYQKNNFYYDAENQTYVFSTGYAQLRPYVNGKALFNALQNDAFVNRVLLNCTGSSYPAINPTMLGQLLLSMPKDGCEAACIGQMFVCLDAGINKGESRLSSLRQLRRAMLVKMFPRPGQSVPEIRFKGFDGEWGYVPLADIADKVVEKNVQKEYSEVFTNSAECGIVSQREYFDFDVAKNIGGYYVVRNGDFVYNPRMSKEAPVGPINMNNLGRAGVMSPLYFVFRTHGIDEGYLSVYFKTKCWHPFMLFNGDSGARSDRFSIRNEVFMRMPISKPSLPEQRKIAAFFRNLDRLIGAAEKKVAKLRRVKSSLLERMFV